MHTLVLCALWLAGLGIALYASERMVVYVTALGSQIGMAAGVLGLIVALGADAPEISSALIAIAQGNADIGLGVVFGSNIYNLAGLLGLSAVIAGQVHSGRALLTVEGGLNLVLTALAAVLAFAPSAHRPLGVLLLIALGSYAIGVVRFTERTEPEAIVE